MDIWDFLARNTSTAKIEYKKWLDVSSSHFSFIDQPSDDKKYAKQVVRRAQEIYLESGRNLVYISSHQYFSKGTETSIPLFLSPVVLEWYKKEEELHWKQSSSYFILNPNLFNDYVELANHELEDWLANQTFLDKSKVIKGQSALYFDLNHKAYIQRDLSKIQSSKMTSKALSDLFNQEIKVSKTSPSPDFLSLIHSLPLDYSQAQAIDLAQETSCYIAGPPGTGKSQTIINLAIQEMMSGKRVAILSQKKAALDVLIQRFDRLGLDSLILNLIYENRINDFYSSAEVALDKAILWHNPSIEEGFNFSYFKHCIRTIEDYFTAIHQLKSIVKRKTKLEDVKNESLSHPILKLYFPKIDLINKLPFDLIQEIFQVQNWIRVLKIPIEAKVELIASLESPLYLISQYDIVILRKLFKQRRIPKEVEWIEKKIKLHVRSKPQENSLAIINQEKLEYFREYLKENKFWYKLYNPRAKEVEKEIITINKDWNKLKVWDKLDQINTALNFIQWEAEHRKLILDERKYKNENIAGGEAEGLKYILNKLNSNIPSWAFISENWLKGNNFQQEEWLKLIKKVKWMIQMNPNLSNYTMDMIMKLNLSAELFIERIQWEQLCSINFENFNEWDAYVNGKGVSYENYPVLKNYKAKELFHMANFVRNNYANFVNFQLECALNKYFLEKSDFLGALLKSRKKDTKTMRDSWKASIQFIQKKWSSKRNKPTLFQVLSKLDFDFLQWLKPLTISSIDKFSQFFSLTPELYDVIIIDEASQIELLDSIPALIRAKKVIIVGDSQQLTPTRFFKYQNFNLETPHESLLELAEEKLPSIQLNYQYRAKYRELIYYSNFNFYANKLKTTNTSSKQALQRFYLANGVYHNRKNNLEAEKIVAELKAHLIQSGHSKSIGVITFSIQQKEVILSKLDEEISADQDFRDLLRDLENKQEPFFVKSIEQVQGDERDIILISSGYGKNEKGKIYQFFGPILMHKGENRLNVLMSRAREKIVFVTSLLSTDLQISSDSNSGLRLFKALLDYIENPTNTEISTIKKEKNYWEYLINPFRK